MNRKAFYDSIRGSLGALTTANVVGFELCLDEAERRRFLLQSTAITIATAWWESGKTMQPVKEAYWLSEEWRKKNLRYYPFYGRGLVQLTWEENYKKGGELLGVDLVRNPDLAMDPKNSVILLFDGMQNGWFTGKKIDDFIDNIDESDAEDLREYANARRVVNGIDRAVEIGKLAQVFERGLRAGDYGRSVVPIVIPPAPIVVEPVEDTPAGIDGYTIPDFIEIIRTATAGIERLTNEQA